MPLTEQSIRELKAQNPKHVFLHGATSSYHEGPVSPAELASLMKRVSDCGNLVNEKRACVVFGRGSQTRQEYREIGQIRGLSILWQGAFTPWWLLPLAIVAAAHGGLVLVMDGSQAAPLMLRLSNLAMVELYSFRADLLDAVVEQVRQERWRADVGPVVGNDPSYFTVGIDGDSHESVTGVLAWVSYGADCPADLKSLVSASRSS